MRKCALFIAIVTMLYLPLSLLDYNHFPYSDGPEHGAAVRELAKNFARPSDPMLAGQPGNSPRFVPSILVMALTMRLTGLDVLTVLKLFLPLFFLFFLISSALFAKDYFDDTHQAPWTLAAFLVLWGTGWMGANAYMFSAILYTAYFPSLVAFSLSLLALYFQLRFLKARNRTWFIIQLLLGSIAFVNHPPTGVFFFTCSGLLYIERRVAMRAAAGYFLATAAAALFLAALWPYNDFFPSLFTIASGAMADTADYRLTRHYLFDKPLLRSGTALVGIPLMLLFALQRRYFLLTRGFILFSCAYLLGFFFKISLAERFIFFIICMLQLAVSRSCRAWFPGLDSPSSSSLKTAAAWFLVMLLFAGTVIQGTLVYREFILPAVTVSSDHRSLSYASPNRMQRELGIYLKEGDIVLSDLYTSWSVPVYTGAKIIALYHSAPHVRDNSERIRAIETFFNDGTSSEARKKILERYSVTHILLNFQIAGKNIAPAIQEAGFEVIMQDDNFCLFSVISDSRRRAATG
jgi:hypothetical protein